MASPRRPPRKVYSIYRRLQKRVQTWGNGCWQKVSCLLKCSGQMLTQSKSTVSSEKDLQNGAILVALVNTWKGQKGANGTQCLTNHKKSTFHSGEPAGQPRQQVGHQQLLGHSVTFITTLLLNKFFARPHVVRFLP